MLVDHSRKPGPTLNRKRNSLAHKASREEPFCARCLGEHKEMTPAYFASPIVASSWSGPCLASQGQEAGREHVSNVSTARSLGCMEETQLPQKSSLYRGMYC